MVLFKSHSWEGIKISILKKTHLLKALDMHGLCVTCRLWVAKWNFLQCETLGRVIRSVPIRWASADILHRILGLDFTSSSSLYTLPLNRCMCILHVLLDRLNGKLPIRVLGSISFRHRFRCPWISYHLFVHSISTCPCINLYNEEKE